MFSSSVTSWGSRYESDTVLSSSSKSVWCWYKEQLRNMEKWHLAASSQSSFILSTVYPNIWENMTFVWYQILTKTLTWILVTVYFPKLWHERENLQTHHWKHKFQTNSHSEKFQTYFQKYTVVCCHQIIQLQGSYLEESKFQHCGKTYIDITESVSELSVRFLWLCTGVLS